MINLIFDPKIFNYIILTLFLLASIRWAFAESWADCLYWFAAFQLNAAITWGFSR